MFSEFDEYVQIPVKAGQVVQIPLSLAVLNTNPTIWGADAYKYKPERSLTPGGIPRADTLPHGPYGTLAMFIDGPRVCIGWRPGVSFVTVDSSLPSAALTWLDAAVMEFKIMVALLIRDLVFGATNAKIEECISGTVQAFCEGKGAYMPLKITLVA
ncbi:hypothetical protein B0H10DRAFT_2207495 [Mycena sp. CBHHK59/15]|nr:hypothetical protein B0H10DRAFT_2207495 [Mycena sp. CBHHK59/15]